jgi:hypothetical protein
MKERPILFTPGNYQAILDGSKTQTRRIVKPEPVRVSGGVPYRNSTASLHGAPGSAIYRCPYGQRGDRLWVRETWQVDAPRNGTWADTQFYGCKGSPLSDIPARYRAPEHCLFRASWTGTTIIWRPSIFMPKWAARLWLEITDVRVERLQETSEEDCLAEGIVKCTVTKGRVRGDPDYDMFALEPGDHCRWEMTPQTVYRKLWESINGDGSWDVNPFVWAISFRRANAS